MLSPNLALAQSPYKCPLALSTKGWHRHGCVVLLIGPYAFRVLAGGLIMMFRDPLAPMGVCVCLLGDMYFRPFKLLCKQVAWRVQHPAVERKLKERIIFFGTACGQCSPAGPAGRGCAMVPYTGTSVNQCNRPHLIRIRLDQSKVTCDTPHEIVPFRLLTQ